MSFLGILGNCNLPESEVPDRIIGGLKMFYQVPTRMIEGPDSLLFLIGFALYNGRTPSTIHELESSDGTFAYVHCDKHSSAIRVGTDKLGFHSLFYHISQGKLIFGILLPHIKYRLNKVSPDFDAWEEVLNLGDVSGSKTVIKEIKRLREGERIEIVDGSAKLITYWSYEPQPLQNIEDYVRQNNELLLESVLTSSASKLPKIMPLTGGHDSRRLALTVNNAGIKFSSITQAYPAIQDIDLDTPIAQKTARILGIPHMVSPLADAVQRTKDELYKDYWLGFESKDHAWAVNMFRYISEPSLIYDGMIADVSVNGHYFVNLPDHVAFCNTPSKLAELVLNQGTGLSFCDDLIEVPGQERLMKEFSRFPLDHNNLTLFKLFNHTRRNIASWLQLFIINGHNACLPYGYYPFFMQSLALEPKCRNRTYHQQTCMLRISEEIANLASTRDDNLKDVIRRWDLKPMKIKHQPIIPDRIDSRIYKMIEHNFFQKMSDHLYALFPELGIKNGRNWRLKELSRLAFFIKWIETDESDYKPLFKGVPRLINELIEK